MNDDGGSAVAIDDGDVLGWTSVTTMVAAVDMIADALWWTLLPAVDDGWPVGVPVRRNVVAVVEAAFGLNCCYGLDVAVLVLAIALSWSLAASSGEIHAEDHSPNASCRLRLDAAEQTDNRSLERAAGTGLDIESIGPEGCSCRTVEYTVEDGVNIAVEFVSVCYQDWEMVGTFLLMRSWNMYNLVRGQCIYLVCVCVD